MFFWEDCCSRRRFRCGAPRLAEWCTAFGVKRGKRWAAAVCMEQTASRSLCVCEDADISMMPPIFFPFLYRQCAPFRRERRERAESPTEKHENTSTAATKKGMRNLNVFSPTVNVNVPRKNCIFAVSTKKTTRLCKNIKSD